MAVEADRVVLAPTVTSDSLFLSYLGQYFTLAVGDNALSGQIVSSGEDRDVWGYELSFRSTIPIDNMSVDNRLLFNLFDDQKNVVQVKHFPTAQRVTLYCVVGSARYESLFAEQ
jgi:hypothetical protein